MRSVRAWIGIAVLISACTAGAVGPLVSVKAPSQSRAKVKDASNAPTRLLPGLVDLSLNYVGSTDLNQSVRPRRYSHSLDLSLSKSFAKNYSLFGNAGVVYQTSGGDVYRDSNTEPYFQLNDIRLGGAATFKPALQHSLSLGLTQDILVSEESRYLGYRGVSGLNAGHGITLTNWMKLRHSLDTMYIQNRYRYSVAETGGGRAGNLNSDWVTTYALGPSFTVLKNISLSAQFSASATRYMDNSQVLTVGNSYRVAYQQSNWSTWLRYRNRGYAERGESNLWFADPYRRFVSAGIGLEF